MQLAAPVPALRQGQEPVERLRMVPRAAMRERSLDPKFSVWNYSSFVLTAFVHRVRNPDSVDLAASEFSSLRLVP